MPLVGRVRGGGADHHRTLFPPSDSKGRAPMAQAMAIKRLLAWSMGGQARLVWGKGSRRLSATRCLLRDLQTMGTNHSSHLRNQRGAGPATTRGL